VSVGAFGAAFAKLLRPFVRYLFIKNNVDKMQRIR